MTGREPALARFEEIRRRIGENDVRIVAAVNERLRLVAELWRLKEELDLPLFDAAREHRLRATLAGANGGPLSPAGLERLVAEILALTRSELGAPEPPPDGQR